MPAYSDAEVGRPTGVLISAEGLEKSGKTFSILKTAPQPVVYINVDRENRRVVNSLRAEGRRILMSKQYLYVPKPEHLHKAGQASNDPILGANAVEAAALWNPAMQDYKDALVDPKIKTVVFDSGTAGYSLLRVKTFGKTSGVLSVLYAKTNHIWRQMMMEGANSGKVVIFIQRLGPEYAKSIGSDGKEQSNKTGELVSQGYANTNFEVDAIVRHSATRSGFKATLMAEGVGRSDLKGMEFEDDAIDYTTIVAKLTRTKREKWL